MRIAVLTSPESWYFRDLARAAGSDFQLTPLAFSEIRSTISMPPFAGSIPPFAGSSPPFTAASGNAELIDFAAVLVRSMPPGSLEQVVFRMDVLARAEAAGVRVINPPKAMECAIDKYLTTARLAAHGLPTPATVCCQTADDAMQACCDLGKDVVLKPVFGGEGRGITRISDESLALRAFRMLEQMNAVIYVQAFVEHEGFDERLFVLGDVVLGMKRINRDDWRTNVSRGSTTEAIAVPPQLEELALQAARTVGTPIAGVDVLTGRDGQRYVIEVNAVPGWKALASTTGKDIARMVLEFLTQ